MRLPAFAWFLLGFSFMVIAGLATAAEIPASGLYTIVTIDPVTGATQSADAYLLTNADGQTVAATISSAAWDGEKASGYFAIGFVAVVTAWVMGKGFQAVLRSIFGRA